MSMERQRRIIGLVTFVIGFFVAALWSPGMAQQADQIVILETTKGRIVIRVFYSMVPHTAGRFLHLADSGFYNGLTFHRVEDWLIQGGDPNGNGSGNYVDPNTGAPQYLRLECHPRLGHSAGAVAMARASNPNSASCQFYITKTAKPQLNGQYAVFGQVINGASVVMRMQRGDQILKAYVYRPGQDSEQVTDDQQAGLEDAPPTTRQQQPEQKIPVTDSGSVKQLPEPSFAKKRFRKVQKTGQDPQNQIDDSQTQTPAQPRKEETGF
jgi:peptidyl-prolyl cis-trans isomerase B (cyclophilin B)